MCLIIRRTNFVESMIIAALTGLPNDANLKARVHEIDHWIDLPVRERMLGPRHRILRHSTREIAAKYGTDSIDTLIGLMHVNLDYSVTRANQLKKQAKRKNR